MADGGGEGFGYGELEVGGEGGDAMGDVEEGCGEDDDEDELGDGVAEEGEEVVVGYGVVQPAQGAGDVVDEDEGGQHKGGDCAAYAEEYPPYRFELLHLLFPGYSEGDYDDDGYGDPGGEVSGDDGDGRDAYAQDELRQGFGHELQQPRCGVEGRGEQEEDVEGYPEGRFHEPQEDVVGGLAGAEPGQLHEVEDDKGEYEDGGKLPDDEHGVARVSQPPGAGEGPLVGAGISGRVVHRALQGMRMDLAQLWALCGLARWMASAGKTSLGQATEHSPMKVQSQTPSGPARME